MRVYSVRLIFALFLFVWIPAAAGHGYVHSVIVGGQTYPGWNPFADPFGNPSPRVVRKVASDGFVGTSDADLACHHLGDEGTDAVAEAPAGSQIVFQWVYWPSDHQGPVSTYMTSCEGDCSTFSANNARWFKLDDAGFITEGRQWGADKLRADGTSWTSTIPADLAPGEYLVRNEIVALHSITPQFYPSCVQIRVTGDGMKYPSSDQLMTMQEIYEGVSWPNIYLSTDLESFVVPGPPPVTLDGDSSPPPPSVSRSRTSSRAAPTVTTTRSPASTNLPTAQKCFLASPKRRLVRRR